MRILHVIEGLQKAAGTTTFAENVVREQRALGHAVDVITKDSWSKKFEFEKGGSDSFPQLTTNNYQLTTIFHLHGLWSPLLHKAARFARKNKIPVVWSTHGMTAPWSLRHKWWKKCLPWYLYQLPDLKRAALIHCTTDLEAEWNRALGFKNVFIAPLGTNLPAGESGEKGERVSGFGFLVNEKQETRNKKRETRNQKRETDNRLIEKSKNPIDPPPPKQQRTLLCDRRAMAEMKVAEWLEGVDDETFEAALEKLVEEKSAAGEYRFERPNDLGKALAAAKSFFAGYSRKIVKLSDGRCVYFAPDPRSRSRNGDNAISWAEYAFHAVSSGGDKVPGKTYSIRKYNEYKVINTDLIESTLKSERCVPVLRAKPFQDAVKFFGAAHLGGLFDVVVRLDEYGNVNANMTEVTFEASTKRGQKKLPQLVSLTEAIRTVVSHQTATGTYPPNTSNIANPSSPRKGEGSEREGVSTEGLGVRMNDPLTPNSCPLTPKTLLYVGRIYPVKALDNAIRAVALAKKAFEAETAAAHPSPSPSAPFPLALRLVGPDQAGHMAELMSLCESLGLSYSKPEDTSAKLTTNNQQLTTAQVQFIGPKYDAELSAEYDACDALILVSHTENFGATVVDALAHSKPVITSTKTPWKAVLGKNTNDQPLTTNDLASGRCGWWVDNSPESLAKVFSRLLTLSPSRLRDMGANGLALVKERYTWPAIAQNLISHYLKGPRARVSSATAPIFALARDGCLSGLQLGG